MRKPLTKNLAGLVLGQQFFLYKTGPRDLYEHIIGAVCFLISQASRGHEVFKDSSEEKPKPFSVHSERCRARVATRVVNGSNPVVGGETGRHERTGPLTDYEGLRLKIGNVRSGTGLTAVFPKLFSRVLQKKVLQQCLLSKDVKKFPNVCCGALSCV